MSLSAEDFPPLPVMTDREWVEQSINEQKRCNAKTNKRFTELRTLSLNWCKRDMMICAGEIWKWSVKKRGKPDGDGKQLFDRDVQDLVMKGAVAMGMSNTVEELKELSQRCILARNATSHYPDLEALEDVVEDCKNAMKIFPILQTTLPDQWKTIAKYSKLKQLLPDSFKN